MADIIYRAATPADIDAFLALQKEIYGRAPDVVHVQWKFFAPSDLYSGPRLWIAERDGRILANVGAMVFPFWTEGTQSLAAALVDYRSAPETRRQGLAFTLHDQLRNTLRADGISHLFAMPSELGARLCRAIDLDPIFPTPWLRRRVSLFTTLRDRPIPARTILEGPPSTAHLETLWQRLQPEVNNCSIPTPAWITYRYHSAPAKSYRFHLAQDTDGPCGLLIAGQRTFKGRAEAVIANLLVRDHDTATFHALLNALARDARRAGQPGIRTIVGDSPQQRARWNAAHFTRVPGEFLLHARDLRGPLAPSLRTPDTFLPCLGDHDFV